MPAPEGGCVEVPLHPKAPRHGQGLASDVIGFARSQEHRSVGDVFAFAKAAHGQHGLDCRFPLGGEYAFGTQFEEHARFDDAYQHAIGADIELAFFAGNAAHQRFVG